MDLSDAKEGLFEGFRWLTIAGDEFSDYTKTIFQKFLTSGEEYNRNFYNLISNNIR